MTTIIDTADFSIQSTNRVASISNQSMETLLEQISDLGFAWRDVARMLHVSVPAIQKWRRKNARASAENKRNLASLQKGLAKGPPSPPVWRARLCVYTLAKINPCVPPPLTHFGA
ncbi:hypothetical protein KIM372_01080 [Bombiscardovia nodaiensis]|uniref:Uncharacterized protein n=1 Tax=Bombiscardovia nodaiensis TaxID=2932181 RepID=A0ABM8B5R0_9BIFI|nr:hypothetical protein KIM372_01080 [Bombiscardovia nodaiensis]